MLAARSGGTGPRTGGDRRSSPGSGGGLGGTGGADDGGIRLVLIALFTVVETGALAVWLGVVLGAPPVSAATAIGLGVLAAGLLIEHVLTDVAVNGIDLDLPASRVVAFSLSETALWAVWLLVAETVGGLAGVAVAGVVLAVLLVPQHTIEDNVLRAEPLLGRLVDRGTVGFSLIEAVGASVWLGFALELPIVAGLSGGVDPGVVGVVLLAIFLFAEHVRGVGYARRL